MFFELMMQVEAHLAPPNAQLSYLRYGKWAFDASLTSRALDPLNTLLPLPKLVAVPLLLSLGAWLSVRVFSAIEARASIAENTRTDSQAPRLSSNGTATNLGSGSSVLSGSSARLVRLASKAHLP